ncbi:MAG: glycoside hydrolase domain-containing protein, partial [Ferruginibacter sp.]
MKWILVASILILTQNVFAQEIKYTSGKDSWNADSLGNHRAVVQFNGTGKLAKVIIPWRRSDNNPGGKRIIVQDAKSGQKITNVKIAFVNNEAGEIYFEPISGKGLYHVYYMPYKNEGRSNYPKGVYLPSENTATINWLQNVTLNMPVNTVVNEIQSINEFSSFYPMEVIATQKETAMLTAKSINRSFIVFPEDRIFSIRMKNKLPYTWIKKGLKSSFTGVA